ncbi:MAG: aconitase X catalytic domain-containing protein [Terracidiphilus sp.]|jgi:predicted aconitase
MILTDQEKKMLDGEEGYPSQKAMQILVQLGEIYDADRMIPVSKVHMPGSSVVVAGEAGTRLVEKMAAQGGHFRVFTTLNTGAVDMDHWSEIGYSRETYDMQQRLTRAYEKLGGLACHTCTPYFIGSIPRLGEHVAWGESSAIAFVNSVLGARTNREGGPSALAAALTGLAPNYGLHRQENRYGQIHIKVATSLNGAVDYGSLGYWVGRRTESKIPVFTGIPKDVTTDQLKMLSAALASSGSVALFHIVGVTPEAADILTAFGGRQPLDVLTFDRSGLGESEGLLNKHQGQAVSIVVIGCPHASIQEIESIARLLGGKKVHDGMELWITAAQPTKAYAERCGFEGTIRSAGGRIVTDTCPILSPMAYLAKAKNLKALATNSAKLAHYAPGQWGMPTYYGSLEACILTAIDGVARTASLGEHHEG